jgi:hypothetical protein
VHENRVARACVSSLEPSWLSITATPITASSSAVQFLNMVRFGAMRLFSVIRRSAIGTAIYY